MTWRIPTGCGRSSFFTSPPTVPVPTAATAVCVTHSPPLFDEYNVDIVFSGHDHDYEHSVVSDVVYIVNGGGGGTLRDPAHYNPYSVYFAKTNHCVSITIDGNTLTGVGVQPDGTQFDPFTIIKPFVHAGFNSSSPDWLGQVTVFTNTTASSSTPTYLWAFGDGATSMLVNLTHTYTFPASIPSR